MHDFILRLNIVPAVHYNLHDLSVTASQKEILILDKFFRNVFSYESNLLEWISFG